MCKPDNGTAPVIKRKHSLLLTKESFDFSDEKTADGKTPFTPAPTVTSSYMTILFHVLVLCVIEYITNFVFGKFQHVHPLMEVEKNRGILARHFGVDLYALGTCSILGLKNASVCKNVFDRAFGRSNSMPEAGYEARLFTYHPGAQQLLLFFVAYNVKNLYDSYVWEDGPEFIFHHVVSIIVAWNGMYPGCAHFYAIFFMGISEISTWILSLLASFDDEYGVVGLGAAFPITKIVLGVVFAISFIICRAILWPLFSYYIMKDSRLAFKVKSEKLEGRKFAIIVILTICAALTLLQAVWLVQIIVQGRDEIMALLEKS